MLEYDIRESFCTKGPRIRGKSRRFKKIHAKTSKPKDILLYKEHYEEKLRQKAYEYKLKTLGLHNNQHILGQAGLSGLISSDYVHQNGIGRGIWAKNNANQMQATAKGVRNTLGGDRNASSKG